MVLGIELGSTRIKAVLIDKSGNPLAEGGFEWENQLADGLWTYSLDYALHGVQVCYANMKADYEAKLGKKLESIDAIGISAMMHGYLAFNANDELLVPFRTWRNTNTAEAAREISAALNFNMPQRWSASHYYQAILNGEAHVSDVTFLTTLAGYIHWKLTGEKVLGIGDASGMFPIKDGTYDKDRLVKYDELLNKHGIENKMEDLLPRIISAGENAGTLTTEGALILDPSGDLKAGIPLCAPEGDAGTGMVATNAVRAKTGNVSAGTSAFVMIVLEKALSAPYEQIDIVTTPTGKDVAMVHVNNCTSEINAWASLFNEVLVAAGVNLKKSALYDLLFFKSAESDADTGKLFGCNFLSGEPIADVAVGRPMFIRTPDGKFNLANFMQVQLYSALAGLHLGMRILEAENVQVESVCGHGGFFKTEFIGQNAMSAALGTPVTVMKNAGEGGAYGIAILALYRLNNEKTLEDFLDDLYAGNERSTVNASDDERAKFKCFAERYESCLKVERIAHEVI